MRWLAALAVITFIGASCTRTPSVRVPPQSDAQSRMRESITITTQDDVRVAGHWYPVVEPKGWALLLHMMPATKESYAGLAEALQQRGIASLAIDFRGHGESQGGPNGYEGFSSVEQQAKIKDVEAAVAWLTSRGMTESRFVLVGASIGANLALQWLAAHAGVPAAVLLSPGLDYRGVRTEPLAQSLTPFQRTFLAAGGADDEYSTATVRRLAAGIGDRAVIRMFASAGHGTTMFEREPAFLAEVADWVTAAATAR